MSFNLFRRVACVVHVLLGLMFGSLAFAAPDNNHELLLSRSFLVDVDGKLTIDDIQTLPFKPIKAPLARGYTPTVTWVKLVVAANSQPELVLGVQPTFLDNVRLYSPNTTGGWTVQQQGDQFAYSQRARQEVIFSFPIKPQAQQSSVHYLRVVTTSSHLLYVKVRSTEDSQGFNSSLHSFMGLYLGLVVMMLLWAVLRWVQTRDSLWGATVFMQLASVFIATGHMGFVAKFLLPDQPHVADLWVSYASAWHFFAGSLFIFGLVRSFKPHWLAMLGFGWPVFIVSPVVFGLLLSGQVRTGMSINTLGLLTVPIVNSIGSFFVRPADRMLRYAIRVTYLFLTLYLIYFSLPIFGLATMTDMQLYPALLANFFTSAMFLLVLMRRDSLRTQANVQEVMLAQTTRQQLAWEQQRRVEDASFMSMLLHELKTPLSSIRLASLSLNRGLTSGQSDEKNRLNSINQATDDMDAVLERCRETDRFESGTRTIDKAPQDAVQLLTTCITAHRLHKRVVLDAPMHLQVSIDAPLVAMMVRNLLSNALAYSPPNSEVSVRLHEAAAQRCFYVTVRNAMGKSGLPDPTQVFNKYYRGEAAHHHTGTGLGLYWVRGMARMMGGDCTYTAPPTGQTDHDDLIFELRLPS